MKQEDGEAVAPLTVRAEIDKRLAELVPERFIASPMKRTSDTHFVCMATDEIKRLHTLRELMANKREALVKRNLEIARDAKERIFSIGRSEGNNELKTPGSPLFVANETMSHLDGELRRTNSLGELVDVLLWLEVRRQHADLETKPVCICDDWSLCSVDENASKPAVITRVIIKDDTPPANPERSQSRRLH